MTDPISEGGKPGETAQKTGDPLAQDPSGAKTYSSFDEALSALQIEPEVKKSLQDLTARERSRAVTEAQKEWSKKSIPVEEADRRADERANRIVEERLKARDLVADRHRILREQFGVETHREGAVTESLQKVGAQLKAFAKKAGIDYDIAVSTPEGFRALCLSSGMALKAARASEDPVGDSTVIEFAGTQKEVGKMTAEEKYHAAAAGLIPWPK